MKKNKKFIWDYDINKMNFDDPDTMRWYLKRKIEFGDWNSIDTASLARYLPELDIDPEVKHILFLFSTNAKTAHTASKESSSYISKK